MIGTGFRLKAAIAASAAAVVAALAVAVAPAAHAARWAACSVPNDPKNPSAAVCLQGSIADEPGAAKYADNTCKYKKGGGECHTVVTYAAGNCGAVALGGNQWGGGTGPTRQAAEQAALNNLQVPDGKIVTSGCISE